MAVVKVSVSLDESVIALARERVGARGVSGYVNDAVRRQLRRDALTDLLAEMEAKNGPVSEAEMERVRRIWPTSRG